ncbi:MAG TPA: RimK family alpha-L-glutamate ligase [Pirellulales bacterium]
MRLGILSVSEKCYSTRRLLEAAARRGHDARILDTRGFAIDLASTCPDLIYEGKRVDDFDAILPRIGASITYYGTAVVRQFEQMDVFCANSAHGIVNARDKLRSLQILSRHDIGIPKTSFVKNREDVLPAIERVGGVPIIIKVLEGTQGVGVILAESINTAEAIIETLRNAQQNVLIQKFVAESKGRDVRAFVVGDRVVAAMRRVAQGQEFRSNIHRGGKAEAINLDPAFAKTAVRAAQIMGLRIAGVDMLESSEGPQIMEVNSSPGLEGIEGSTHLDVAGEIIDFIAGQVNFPEVDVRQKLTVHPGCTVVELDVSVCRELIGKTIDEIRLRAKDVIVLTLNRDGNVIPSPQSVVRLEASDRLVCFGKMDELKKLIRDRPPRRRRVPAAVGTV